MTAPDIDDDVIDVIEITRPTTDDVQRVIALAHLRKATGGLPPDLVAKALDWCSRNYRQLPFGGWNPDEIAAIRAASFEVPT